MNVQLKKELSTANPDNAEESVVDKSVDDVLEDKSREEMIEQLMRRGHFGPFEHPQVVVAIDGMSVVCERQLTRHRHLSFDVQSMRYVNFEDADTVVPDSIETNTEAMLYDKAIRNSFQRYDDLVEEGVPEEDARMVLPLGTKVNATMSGNARAMMHLIDMRLAGNAQKEIRELAEQLLDELEDWAPLTFEKYREYAKGSSKKAP